MRKMQGRKLRDAPSQRNFLIQVTLHFRRRERLGTKLGPDVCGSYWPDILFVSGVGRGGPQHPAEELSATRISARGEENLGAKPGRFAAKLRERVQVREFREPTICCKWIGIFTLISGAALVVAWRASEVSGTLISRRATLRDLATLAENFRQNAATSPASSDQGTASQVLSTLRAKPRVMAAAAYSREGEVLAEYGRANTCILLSPTVLRRKEAISNLHRLAVFHQIARNGDGGGRPLSRIRLDAMGRPIVA